jgi:WD40 repeat protein
VRDLTGFGVTIDAIDLSPDGQLLAACGWRNTNVIIFETATGFEHREYNADAKLHCVRFSPGGQALYTGREDGKLQVRSPEEGGTPRLVNVSERAIYDLAITHDGNHLFACGGDWRQPDSGFLKLLDARALTVVADLAEHKHAVRSVALSPDGTQLASADQSGLVVVWNLENRLPLHRFTNSAGVRPLAWSPDGSLLAAGLHDGGIHLWTMATGELARRFLAEDDVFSIAFARDGSVLFSASGKPRVEIWPIVETSSSIEQIRTWVP